MINVFLFPFLSLTTPSGIGFSSLLFLLSALGADEVCKLAGFLQRLQERAEAMNVQARRTEHP